MEGKLRQGSQSTGTTGSKKKMLSLDVVDSSDEAESEAGVDPDHIQVDSEVRIKSRQHNTKLEQLPNVPYDDPDEGQDHPLARDEPWDDDYTVGLGQQVGEDARSGSSQGTAKSETQTMVESITNSVM